MALPTYTNLNVTGDAVLMLAVDSGVGSAPYDRPSVLTPAGGYVAVPSSQDYGVGATPTVRPKTFEPPSYTATIDLGMIVNG